ncbi:hypothetical protein C1G86_1563 [Dehalococcoides mccartyi]|uniref:Uncharacterized protein n=1 Tax=Dehalococcoides mccartyi TaxID=61435 RepID=A0A328EJG3_9CHLR|nr:hypothetical protein C1G87_1596 [Dehalococcoides mccartyi]RAL70036.1 hypothetical protein C1G86_1563 [Dehalococcoides mccartyi]
MIRANLQASNRNCTEAIVKLFLNGPDAAQVWMDCAVEVIDTYLTSGADDSIFEEPIFKNTFNNDLNGFLKWENLGKSEQDSPRLRNLLAVNKSVMGHKIGSISPRDMIKAVITANV